MSCALSAFVDSCVVYCVSAQEICTNACVFLCVCVHNVVSVF